VRGIAGKTETSILLYIRKSREYIFDICGIEVCRKCLVYLSFFFLVHEQNYSCFVYAFNLYKLYREIGEKGEQSLETQ
jgi:hypothetical protein